MSNDNSVPDAETPDEVQESSRLDGGLTVIPDAIESVANAIVTTDKITATIDEACNTTLANIDEKIRAYVASCWADCSTVNDSCSACILGSIERIIERSRPILEKCDSKVSSRLASSVIDAFNSASVVGVPYPSEDDIRVILTGGIVDTGKGINDRNTVAGNELGARNPPSIGIRELFNVVCIDNRTLVSVPVVGTDFGAPGWKIVFGPASQAECSNFIANNPDICFTPPTRPEVPITPALPRVEPEIPGEPIPNQPPAERIICPSGTQAFHPGVTQYDPNTTYLVSSIDAITGEQTGRLECYYTKPLPPNVGPPPEIPITPIGVGPEPPTESHPIPTPKLSVCSPDSERQFAESLRVASVPYPAGLDLQPGVSPSSVNATADYPRESVRYLVDLLPKGYGETTAANIIAEWIGNVFFSLVLPAWNNSGCSVADILIGTGSYPLIKAFSKIFGIVPAPLDSVYDYSVNYKCQWNVISVADANVSYVRGTLNKEQWEYALKLRGECIPWQEPVIESSWNRIQPIDAYRLYYLNQIDEDQYLEILRRNGIPDDKKREEFELSVIQYPGFQDIIRFMVRDSADRRAVELGGFDIDFEKKFDGKLKEWAAAQGVSEEVARYYWRAHWELPSPTQLYEMLHRLRPNDRSPDDPYKDIVVTSETIEEVLKQNDMAPNWVKPMMAISYSPLTRVDARRAYEIGAIGEDDLRRQYLDGGYSPVNANAMVKFTKMTSSPARAKRDSALTESEIQKSYLSSVITESEAYDLLNNIFDDPTLVDKKIGNMRLRKQIKIRENALRYYKKRYMYGEFADEEATAKLVESGFDASSAIDVVKQWRLERNAKYKAPTVGMLCEWWGRGLITMQEYLRRVNVLGFSVEDALRIVETCGLKRRDKLEKDAEQEAARQQQRMKQIAAEERRVKKENEKLLKDMQPCRTVKPKCVDVPSSNGKK